MHPEHHLSLDPSTATAPALSSTASPMTLSERLSLFWFRALTRVNIGVMTLYAGAIALVGIEGVAVVLTFTSMWPVAVPFVIGILAAIYFARERIFRLWRLRHDGSGEDVVAERDGREAAR